MSSHEARLAALREQLQARPARRLRRAADRRAYERICRQLCPAARLADRLPGLGGHGGGAARGRRRSSSTGATRCRCASRSTASYWSYQSVPQTSIADWLKAHAPDGGADRLRSLAAHQGLGRSRRREALAGQGRRAGRGRQQPDRRGLGRPARAVARRGWSSSPTPMAGKSSADKRHEVADWLKEQKADAAVLAALDSIAWTFNVRGQDVDAHPGRAVLRDRPRRRHRRSVRRRRKRSATMSASISATACALHERERFRAALGGLAGKPVAVDPERSVAAIFEALDEGRRQDRRGARSRRSCPRRSRTRSRLPGHRAAQARDGAALSRSSTGSRPRRQGRSTTSSAPRRSCRASASRPAATCATLSFDTISGAGPNGAHRPLPGRARRPTGRCRPDTIYLVDSGGQYPDGTTDITRTVSIGTPTARDEGPLHPRAPGPYRARPRALPARDARRRSSTASRASSCGRPGSITPTAPATASAASSRSTKGRSGSRRSAAPRPAATSR